MTIPQASDPSMWRSALPSEEGSRVQRRIERGHLEVTAASDSSWRVSDASVPDEDALHVVAFIEAREEDVEVVWLRGAISAPGRFENLDSALDAIDDFITLGEVRDPLAGIGLTSASREEARDRAAPAFRSRS
jgi:hypothetical protein